MPSKTEEKTLRTTVPALAATTSSKLTSIVVKALHLKVILVVFEYPPEVTECRSPAVFQP